MFESILKLLTWLSDAVGTSASRHKERALAFIKEASERAALRKKK